jgi:threonine dehydrogenase-like Zn-dependent dehydrogenase
MLKEQPVIFLSCYSIINGQHGYELAIAMLASGRAPLQQIVTHIYPLEAIGQGFATAYNKTTGSIKVQIHQS